MQKIPIIGLLMQFVGYKYSQSEYLYGFCAEARQTARKIPTRGGLQGGFALGFG
jgi:hypothetical protein